MAAARCKECIITIFFTFKLICIISSLINGRRGLLMTCFSSYNLLCAPTINHSRSTRDGSSSHTHTHHNHTAQKRSWNAKEQVKIYKLQQPCKKRRQFSIQTHTHTENMHLPALGHCRKFQCWAPVGTETEEVAVRRGPLALAMVSTDILPLLEDFLLPHPLPHPLRRRLFGSPAVRKRSVKCIPETPNLD